MRKVNVENLPIVLIGKTCARCGQDFGALGREYTCPRCRKPKSRKQSVVSMQLSFRERQIVQLVQQAKSNKEIAFELCLAVGTVKEYVHHVFLELGVKNRTELALWGRDHGSIGDL